MSADFQDVSKQFAGFAALKMGAAGDKAALDQLAQMEKAKGLQRLGFGLGLSANSKSRPTDGVTLEWDQIQDKTANDAKKHIPASALIGTTGTPVGGANATATKATDAKTPEPILARLSARVPPPKPEPAKRRIGLEPDPP